MIKNALGIKKVLKRKSGWERKQHTPLYKENILGQKESTEQFSTV